MRPRLNINQAIIDTFPGFTSYILYVTHIVNNQEQPVALDYLRQAERILRDSQSAPLAETEVVKHWRNAYKVFGAKPRDGVCAYEALAKRVLNGDELPDINPVVNIYNAISLKYQLPVGGEDWDNIHSDLELCFSNGAEPFITGTGHNAIASTPRKGEVIWKDSSGVTCRRWNWRQCTRTQITPETKAAYFVLDALPIQDCKVLNEAVNELIQQLKIVSPDMEWELDKVTFTPTIEARKA